MSIIYDVNFTVAGTCRAFNIYGLNPNSKWTQL